MTEIGQEQVIDPPPAEIITARGPKNFWDHQRTSKKNIKGSLADQMANNNKGKKSITNFGKTGTMWRTLNMVHCVDNESRHTPVALVKNHKETRKQRVN